MIALSACVLFIPWGVAHMTLMRHPELARDHLGGAGVGLAERARTTTDHGVVQVAVVDLAAVGVELLVGLGLFAALGLFAVLATLADPAPLVGQRPGGRGRPAEGARPTPLDPSPLSVQPRPHAAGMLHS